MMMRLSPQGAAFIQGYEQCRLVAYQDVRGRWTIGWGHTGDDVGPGTRWTQDVADATFLHDIMWVEEAIASLVKVTLTQNQFDALAAFIFNVGKPAFAQSTLLRLVNAKDWRGARTQFPRWNKSTIDGKLVVVDGLTARRRAEAAMFGRGSP